MFYEDTQDTQDATTTFGHTEALWKRFALRRLVCMISNAAVYDDKLYKMLNLSYINGASILSAMGCS